MFILPVINFKVKVKVRSRLLSVSSIPYFKLISIDAMQDAGNMMIIGHMMTIGHMILWTKLPKKQ